MVPSGASGWEGKCRVEIPFYLSTLEIPLPNIMKPIVCLHPHLKEAILSNSFLHLLLDITHWRDIEIRLLSMLPSFITMKCGISKFATID